MTAAGAGVTRGRGGRGVGVAGGVGAPRVGEGCEIVSVGVEHPGLAGGDDLVGWYIGLTG